MKRQAGFIYSEETKSFEYFKNKSVELFMTYIGYKEYDAGYRINPVKREDYILCIVIKGKGGCEINDNIYYMQEGDAFLVYPKIEVQLKAHTQEPWALVWIGFSGMKAEECVVYSGFSQKSPVQSIGHIEGLTAIIKQMLGIRDRTFSDELKRNGLLQLFFAELIEQYNKKQSDESIKTSQDLDTSVYIRDAIAYIAENYNSNIKINELADYIGVNRSYLASSFKKVTGYSPKEYLTRLRMEKAKSLLEKTDMPINSVANSVGYTDQLAFSRMFKNYSGKSPKAYREDDKE